MWSFQWEQPQRHLRSVAGRNSGQCHPMCVWDGDTAQPGKKEGRKGGKSHFGSGTAWSVLSGVPELPSADSRRGSMWDPASHLPEGPGGISSTARACSDLCPGLHNSPLLLTLQTLGAASFHLHIRVFLETQTMLPSQLLILCFLSTE